jgi:hypothetical protein
MLPRATVRVLLAVFSVLFLAIAPACDGDKVRTLEDETLTVACGGCVFEMEEAKGCPWAAQVDGKYYFVLGNVPGPETHDSHAPDGMCNMPRKAVVSGELRKDNLVVSKMELIPAENVPEKPRFTTEEH